MNLDIGKKQVVLGNKGNGQNWRKGKGSQKTKDIIFNPQYLSVSKVGIRSFKKISNTFSHIFLR